MLFKRIVGKFNLRYFFLFCAGFLAGKVTFLPKPYVGNGQQDVLLFVLLFSEPETFQNRQVIRETWLTNNDVRLSYRFFIGTQSINEKTIGQLKNEQEKYNDLVLLDTLSDTYQNLANKLLVTLSWTVENVHFDFLLKADQDTFIRIDTLINELSVMRDVDDLYWGYFAGASRVKRKGRWREVNWWMCDRYLPYALGGAYVLSRNIVDYVAENGPRFQKYLSEDVSMGAWTAALRLNRRHDVRFDTAYMSRGCRNDFVATHKQSVSEIRQKWQNLKRSGKLCGDAESVNPLIFEYEYNWKVTPSQCCLPKKT